MSEENSLFTCPQCPKIFATRSNLKRHMENPNIHNIPYARSRDQKRWKGHSKKVSSRAETTERMRKWRAENRDKNKRNDLRCRVYRLARQKFGEEDSEEKQKFIHDEINKRLGRRMLLEQKTNNRNQLAATTTTTTLCSKSEQVNKKETLDELPFYCAPLHKIELPSVDTTYRRTSCQSNTTTTEPSEYRNSQPPSPVSDHSLSWHENDPIRRHSGCSINSSYSSSNSVTSATLIEDTMHHTIALPPMQTILTSIPSINSPAIDQQQRQQQQQMQRRQQQKQPSPPNSSCYYNSPPKYSYYYNSPLM
ncbi:MAG: hypothetical protein EXX96DRAFT_617781 [Benjaminiella poitrasii]|nr:MAG: hypothetical protein EXX96DRAFT_617781 [Benjaminiella poitrasii]